MTELELLEKTQPEFERALIEFGKPDPVDGYILDSGNLFWIWGRAIEAARSILVQES